MFKKGVNIERKRMRLFYENSVKQKVFFAFMKHIVNKRKICDFIFWELSKQRKKLLQMALRNWKTSSALKKALLEGQRITKKVEYKILDTKRTSTIRNPSPENFSNLLDEATNTFRKNTYMKSGYSELLKTSIEKNYSNDKQHSLEKSQKKKKISKRK